MTNFSPEVVSENVAKALAMLVERRDGEVVYKDLNRVVFVDGFMLIRTDKESHGGRGLDYLDVFGDITWQLAKDFQGTPLEEVDFGKNWMIIKNERREGGLRSSAAYINVPEGLLRLVEHKARVDLGMIEKTDHGSMASLVLIRNQNR